MPAFVSVFATDISTDVSAIFELLIVNFASEPAASESHALPAEAAT